MSKNGLSTHHRNISFDFIFIILFIGPTGRISTGVTKAAESTGVSSLSASWQLFFLPGTKARNNKQKRWKAESWCFDVEQRKIASETEGLFSVRLFVFRPAWSLVPVKPSGSNRKSAFARFKTRQRSPPGNVVIVASPPAHTRLDFPGDSRSELEEV